MANYAYLDLCFFEFCNLSCDYCRTSNKGTRGSIISLELFTDIVNSFLSHSQAAVFKVSGYGEVSLWPYLVNAMKLFSTSFPSLQVMTNGTMSKQLFEGLSEIENLVFCITIDNHKIQSNRHRNKQKEHLHKRMINFAKEVILKKRKLEINCVLSSSNIDNFPEFLLYAQDHFLGEIMVMPFPVRPFAGLNSFVQSANTKQIDYAAKQIFSRYNDFDMVLPSLAYMERLFEFMCRGERTFPCYVPAFNYGVGPKLKHLSCACLGHTKPSDDLSNITDLSQNNILLDVSSFRQQRISKGYVDRRCKYCFTHYEILNLYLEGIIGKHDMLKIPSFNVPKGYIMVENAKKENDLYNPNITCKLEIN